MAELSDLDARAHRGTDGNLLDEDAFGGRRTRSSNLIGDHNQVVNEFVCIERNSSRWDVHIPISVISILDSSGLELSNGLRDIVRHRSRLRIRHQTPWSKDLTELSNNRHHVGRSDRDIPIQRNIPANDPISKILPTDKICSGPLLRPWPDHSQTRRP